MDKKTKDKWIATYNEDGIIGTQGRIIETHEDNFLIVEFIPYFDMITFCMFGGIPDDKIQMELCGEIDLNENKRYKIFHSFLSLASEFIRNQKSFKDEDF